MSNEIADQIWDRFIDETDEEEREELGCMDLEDAWEYLMNKEE